MRRSTKAALMAEALTVAAYTIKLWGTGAIGPALVARFFTDDPWVSVDELATSLHLSTAGVRRRLDELAALGRVEVRWRGRSKVYCADETLANKTVVRIAELCGGVALCNERFPA